MFCVTWTAEMHLPSLPALPQQIFFSPVIIGCSCPHPELPKRCGALVSRVLKHQGLLVEMLLLFDHSQFTLWLWNNSTSLIFILACLTERKDHSWGSMLQLPKIFWIVIIFIFKIMLFFFFGVRIFSGEVYFLVNMELNIPNLPNHVTLIGKGKFTTFSFGFWILRFSSDKERIIYFFHSPK